jgi:DNA polymerase III psi subunit
MNNSSNFLDVLFNDQKLINLGNQPGLFADAHSAQRTLVFSTPLHNKEEKELLANMLTACQLRPEDYLVLQQPVPYPSFNANKHIKEVIIFGVSEKELALPVRFPTNFRFRFNERTIIKTSSLAEIMVNKQLKNELWQKALKPHFLPSN